MSDENKLKFNELDPDATLLTFEKDGNKSYFDFKDGKWQFWGDLPVDESAKLFFDNVISMMDMFHGFIVIYGFQNSRYVSL